jgi:hypothetical protein
VVAPPDDNHTYVLPPEAVNVAVFPEQMDGLFTVIVGVVLMVTVDVAVPLQPLFSPVTEYVVVLPGAAVTLVPIPEAGVNPVVGVHVYVIPPLAVKAAPTPGQAAPLFTITGILPPTVTVTGDVALQPVKVPEAPNIDVTVYVVVLGGLA